MHIEHKDPIDYADMIRRARSVELSPNGEFEDAAAAFTLMARGDFQLSEVQVRSARAFETARSGSCPSCPVFPGKGRHARSETGGRLIEECDLKCALDLLPLFYLVTLQVHGGLTAVKAQTWKASQADRGIAYTLMTTTLPGTPVPTRYEARLDVQLLATSRATSTWTPSTGTSEPDEVKRQLVSAFGASKATVKAL